MEFKDRFNKLLEHNAISDYKIAKDLNISASSVKSYKEGNTKPKHPILELIASYFNVSKDWLLSGEGEMLKTGYEHSDQIIDNAAEPGGNYASISTINRLLLILEKRDRQVDEMMRSRDRLEEEHNKQISALIQERREDTKERNSQIDKLLDQQGDLINVIKENNQVNLQPSHNAPKSDGQKAV